MTSINPGDYLLWEGDLAQIVGIGEGRHVLIKKLQPDICPRCQCELPPHQFSVIVSSPQFRDAAEAVPTIKKAPVIADRG